jgi:hypothetical protein
MHGKERVAKCVGGGGSTGQGTYLWGPPPLKDASTLAIRQ